MKRNRVQKRNKFVRKAYVFVCPLLAFMFYAQSVVSEEQKPLTIKPAILWVSDNVSVPVFDDIAYDSFLGSGEVWYKKWGVSTQLIENNTDDIFSFPADSEYFNVDLKRRFNHNNNFSFELGLGWQEFSIDTQLEASGPRISLAGNYNVLKSIQLYGSTSYLPKLDDSINDNNGVAYEIEAGLLYSPRPSLSLRAGYRLFDLDLGLGDPSIEALGTSSGFLLGSDLSW